MIQKRILELIENYEKIIIHHHINPDCDCMGSQLGLKYMIKATYPNKDVFAVGHHNESTRFLGDLDEISDEEYEQSLVIIVDVGNKERVNDKRFLNGDALIKIDHHPKTEEFGDIEWVDTSFASATEMIVDLFIQNKDKLIMTEKAARCLYAGTLTDTGRYYYNSVTPRTLMYGAELYQFGFDKQALYADIYHQTIAELKFEGYILNQFQYTKNGLAYMKIEKELLERFHISEEFASIKVNRLANIKEIITWIFFVEYKDLGKVRVEFRSRGPIVNKLATKYGGGGHNFASGALVDSWDIVDNIIEDADEICLKYEKKC